MLAGIGARGQLALDGCLGQQGSVSQHRVQRLLLRGYVDGKLNHFEGLAVKIHDRVIGRLDPNFFAALADAFVLFCLVFAAIQFRPELLVIGALPIGFVHEHAVMAALDLFERVAEGVKKVVIGIEHSSVHVESDDRLRFADGGNLARVIGIAQLLFRHVRGVLDHFEGFAVRVEDGVVGGLNPDFLSALADALVFGGLVFATIELDPELLVLRALPEGFVHEHAVMTALDLVQGVTQGIEEIVVGIEDGPVHTELDDRLRFADGRDLGTVIEVQQPLCRVRPLHHRAQPCVAFRIEDRCCHQVERTPSHLDTSLVRLAERIEDSALMCGILVKKVEAPADQLRSVEVRQVFPDLAFRFREQFTDSLVHIRDLVLGIRDHHVRAHEVERREPLDGAAQRFRFSSAESMRALRQHLRRRLQNSSPIPRSSVPHTPHLSFISS